MKSLLLFTTLLFISVSMLSGQGINQAEVLQKMIDQDVADGQFAGGVMGLSVGEQDMVVAAGLRNVDSGAPFEKVTLNRIASISKSMTAVAILQLFEQGKIDLDEPIARYLPDYPQQHAIRITTRQLLLHSSGISAYESSKETESKQQYASLTESATVFQDRPLIAEPGVAENYTTYGYVVLGMIIEAVSGQTYEDYMQQNIFDVAGMAHTGVEYLEKVYENKSSFYHRTKKGKIRPSKINNLSNRIPGGGFYSTADDLLKFGKAVLSHQLITEETFAMMMEKPGLPYEGNPYGMGWFLYGENPQLGQVYGHTGGQTGVSSVLLLIPEKEAVIVVMNNTALTGGHVFGMAVKAFPLVMEMSASPKE